MSRDTGSSAERRRLPSGEAGEAQDQGQQQQCRRLDLGRQAQLQPATAHGSIVALMASCVSSLVECFPVLEHHLLPRLSLSSWQVRTACKPISSEGLDRCLCHRQSRRPAALGAPL